jgi:hypothetical protein
MSLTWRLYRDDGQIKLFPFAVIARPADASRTGKNYAIPACHRDSFLAHNRDNGPDGFAGNANSLNCRAVSVHVCLE